MAFISKDINRGLRKERDNTRSTIFIKKDSPPILFPVGKRKEVFKWFTIPCPEAEDGLFQKKTTSYV